MPVHVRRVGRQQPREHYIEEILVGTGARFQDRKPCGRVGNENLQQPIGPAGSLLEKSSAQISQVSHHRTRSCAYGNERRFHDGQYLDRLP